MFNRKETGVVTTVLFFGVLLSCTIFFGVSYLLETLPSGDFWNIDQFDSSFYENKDLEELVTYFDYKLFRSVKNKNVIVGKDNFLFETERDGYSFIADYVGQSSFTQNELDVILKNLKLRKQVYDEMGIEYLIAVIPNSQSVYSDKFPFYFGEKSKNTRLDQLKAHLKENSDINFLDITNVLTRIKGSYPVYNNTDNTINSLGAYYLYKEAFRALPTEFSTNNILLENYIDGITLHNTNGKELAKLAGVDSVVKNRTLSIQTRIPLMYSSLDLYYNTQVTYIKSEYEDRVPSDTSVMIEYYHEWDKIQITPYFSNTFDTVVYKRNYNFNSRLIKNNFVSAVIQIVRESDLDSFLDSNITLSYNAGMIETEAPEISSTPLMLSKVDVDSNTVCIAGRAAENSTLTIQGAGIKNKTMELYGEQFIVGIKLEDGEEKKVNILATTDGKEASEPLEVTVAPNSSSEPSGIVIGENSRLFDKLLIDRYKRNELYSPIELSRITRSLETELDNIRIKSGKETELVYLVASSKVNVYASDIEGYEINPFNKLKQVTCALSRIDGISLIDLGDKMRDNVHLGPLYYQTSAKWTELGAYLGYAALAEHISCRFPAVKVDDFESFDVSRTYVSGGEYAQLLGLDPIAFSELVPVLTSNNINFSDIEIEGEFPTLSYRSRSNNKQLPTAIVVCDMYGEDMLEFLSPHFLDLRVLSVCEKNVSDALLSALRPDYVIKIFCEDNLDYFLK